MLTLENLICHLYNDVTDLVTMAVFLSISIAIVKLANEMSYLARKKLSLPTTTMGNFADGIVDGLFFLFPWGTLIYCFFQTYIISSTLFFWPTVLFITYYWVYGACPFASFWTATPAAVLPCNPVVWNYETALQHANKQRAKAEREARFKAEREAKLKERQQKIVQAARQTKQPIRQPTQDTFSWPMLRDAAYLVRHAGQWLIVNRSLAIKILGLIPVVKQGWETFRSQQRYKAEMAANGLRKSQAKFSDSVDANRGPVWVKQSPLPEPSTRGTVVLEKKEEIATQTVGISDKPLSPVFVQVAELLVGAASSASPQPVVSDKKQDHTPENSDPDKPPKSNDPYAIPYQMHNCGWPYDPAKCKCNAQWQQCVASPGERAFLETPEAKNFLNGALSGQLFTKSREEQTEQIQQFGKNFLTQIGVDLQNKEAAKDLLTRLGIDLGNQGGDAMQKLLQKMLSPKTEDAEPISVPPSLADASQFGKALFGMMGVEIDNKLFDQAKDALDQAQAALAGLTSQASAASTSSPIDPDVPVTVHISDSEEEREQIFLDAEQEPEFEVVPNKHQ